MLAVTKLAHAEVGGEAAAVLERKTIVVTGASSGIGRAIALRCAQLGRRAEVLQLDLAAPTGVETFSGQLGSAFPRIDVWINNAGADILTGDAGRLSPVQKLEMVMAVDLRGTVLASWAAVRLMREQGSGLIINMAWDHVSQGMAGENPSVYAAAKGGIASFSRSLAREVAPEIRVNILAPGFIETAFGEEANPKFRQQVIEMTPLKRWGTPDDVAGAAAFLASDDASFLTGQTIMVNGGVVM
jgi:3-oxoacyl-[acyl-carrier protein] reductase